MSEAPAKISPALGARLFGIRLSAAPDRATLREIRKAFASHLVLVFEQQSLSPPQLRDFTSHFGPLFVHHADDGVRYAAGVPEVLEMRREVDDNHMFGGSDWHADVTFRRPAGYASVQHSLIVPPVGGDTGFASTIAAFDALSDGMQSLLRSLKAVHSYNGPGRPDHAVETALHPLVRRHPDTGREGIYFNRMFVTRFEDMTAAESRPLIEFLNRHMTRPEFTCRINWRPGQVVMWDNRFTLHYPINDFVHQRRLLIRCTAMEA